MNKIEGVHKEKNFEIKPNEISAFVSEATLEKCKVEFLAKNENLIINNIRMNNCSFYAKKTLENFQFCKANLKGVTFSGRFSGCDFGKWEKKHGKEGGLSDYDFTNVELLHNCRFFNCGMNIDRLPPWPHVILVNRETLKEELSSKSWPKSIGLILRVLANIPKDCSFVSLNLDALSKSLKVSLDELSEYFNDNLFLHRR